MAFGAADVSVFFGDFGVTVVWNGTSAQGNLDTPAMGINFGGGASSLERQQISVTLPTVAFSRLLRNGDSILAAGSPYKVKSRELSLDGQIATYALEAQ